MKGIYTYIIFCAACILGVCSCDDGDSFTSSPNNVLTFETDTVRFDTVFSTVPSSTRSFWIYNKSGDGIRLNSVRLEGGNQNGFRVNVDGTYLSPEQGYKANDVEVRKGDSIRVYAEVTTAKVGVDAPLEISDRLLFDLESGVQQKVILDAWSWNADFLRDRTYEADATIDAVRPLVVYGKLTVEEGATLTIMPGATIYFHDGAGLEINGTLSCRGASDQPVVLRGDRLDKMFDYLPYDRVSGQWSGVHFGEKSYGNVMEYTDIHSCFDGVVVDSSDVSRQTLLLSNSTIHNCQGYGLRTVASKVVLENSQLTNTLNNCLSVVGGDVSVNNCTLAQFYPFDSNRGSALSFSGVSYPLLNFTCMNTIVTGYSSDEMMGGKPTDDNTNAFNYVFENCVIRTPEVVDEDDKEHFVDVTYEENESTDSVGMNHFVRVDGDMQSYDFHLAETSVAIGRAGVETSTKTDHDGNLRDDHPDVGAYEYFKKEEAEE